jgi:hypothetical protein
MAGHGRSLTGHRAFIPGDSTDVAETDGISR